MGDVIKFEDIGKESEKLTPGQFRKECLKLRNAIEKFRSDFPLETEQFRSILGEMEKYCAESAKKMESGHGELVDQSLLRTYRENLQNLKRKINPPKAFKTGTPKIVEIHFF